ncbi:hypothetical protein TYRP_007951 [Tyrophagus putrescentiae]|nr:hypothetical protein TYRP_007951 [Tyrophagus putrescentiae]
MYKIVLVAVSLIPLALASGYEEHGYGGGGDHYDKGYEAHYPPQPYKFGYDVKDGYGGTLNQKEEGDSHGNKKGSYGYTDAYGIYRTVEYVADKHDPADVYMHSSAGPSHYDGGHGSYKAATYSAPSYAPAQEVYAPIVKVAAPVYKAPVSYAMPKAVYSSDNGYGQSSAAYAVPLYSEHY